MYDVIFLDILQTDFIHMILGLWINALVIMLTNLIVKLSMRRNIKIAERKLLNGKETAAIMN